MTRFVLYATVAFAASWSMTAQAEDLPKRRAGLWETTMKSDRAGAQPPIKQCIDDKTDSLAQNAVGPGGPCKQVRSVKAAQGYEVETSCSFGQATSTGKALISGDFSSRVTAQVTSTMVSAPGQPPQTTVMTIDSRYVGPCTADQRPGDIIMPDGKVVRTPGTK